VLLSCPFTPRLAEFQLKSIIHNELRELRQLQSTLGWLDRRRNFQHWIPHRRQPVIIVGLRERFRFHEARPVRQLQELHRFARDLVMRPLSDHPPALRRGGNLDAWGRAQPRDLFDLKPHVRDNWHSSDEQGLHRFESRLIIINK
jgi:hypothetical protein